MTTTNRMFSKTQPDTDGAAVTCMLFADEVSPQLCSIRKKELNQNDAFSCFGCSMEAIIPDCIKSEKQPDGMISKTT